MRLIVGYIGAGTCVTYASYLELAFGLNRISNFDLCTVLFSVFSVLLNVLVFLWKCQRSQVIRNIILFNIVLLTDWNYRHKPKSKTVSKQNKKRNISGILVLVDFVAGRDFGFLFFFAFVVVSIIVIAVTIGIIWEWWHGQRFFCLFWWFQWFQ